MRDMMTLHDDTDSPAPWARQEQEPMLWFERFSQWLRQDQPRSLLKIYRSMCEKQGTKRNGKKHLDQIDCVPESWAIAKVKYDWIARAAAFDEEEQRRKDREWAVGRETERLEELAIARTLRRKMYELLELPVLAEHRKHNRDGEEISVVVTVEFRAFQAAAALAKEAREHARLALEMSSRFEKHEISGPDNGPVAVHHVGDDPVARLEKLLELAERAATEGGILE